MDLTLAEDPHDMKPVYLASLDPVTADIVSLNSQVCPTRGMLDMMLMEFATPSRKDIVEAANRASAARLFD